MDARVSNRSVVDVFFELTRGWTSVERERTRSRRGQCCGTRILIQALPHVTYCIQTGECRFRWSQFSLDLSLVP